MNDMGKQNQKPATTWSGGAMIGLNHAQDEEPKQGRHRRAVPALIVEDLPEALPLVKQRQP